MKSAAVALAVILSSLALLQASSAQTSTSVITNALERTVFWVQPNQRSASSAGFDGSFGLTPLFNTPGLVGFSCMQPAGTKCIYRISVESNVVLSSHETIPTPCVSAIRFLLDKHAPTPSPSASGFGADSGGLEGLFYQTVSTSSSTYDYRPQTLSVVAVVTNTVANQLHAINLDLWVSSSIGNCTATANGAIATIQVFH